MKKSATIALALLCFIVMNLKAQPVINILASFHSEALDEFRNVRVYLPGDFEDYDINDVNNRGETIFRAVPECKGRAMFKQSMGGYGAFRCGLLHYDKFCAYAANVLTLNFQMLVDDIQTKLLTGNSCPPSSYSNQGGGSYTQWMFLMSGAGTPNINTPQACINPAIVGYPFNEYCEPIDTICQKLFALDMIELLYSTLVVDSVGIIYCCGMNDEWLLHKVHREFTEVNKENRMSLITRHAGELPEGLSF